MQRIVPLGNDSLKDSTSKPAPRIWSARVVAGHIRHCFPAAGFDDTRFAPGTIDRDRRADGPGPTPVVPVDQRHDLPRRGGVLGPNSGRSPDVVITIAEQIRRHRGYGRCVQVPAP